MTSPSTSPSSPQLDFGNIDHLIDSVISSDVVAATNPVLSTPPSTTLPTVDVLHAPAQQPAPLQPITLAQLASALPHTVQSLAAHQQQQQQEQAAVQHVLLNTVHQQQQLLKQQQEAAQALTAALAAGGGVSQLLQHEQQHTPFLLQTTSSTGVSAAPSQQLPQQVPVSGPYAGVQAAPLVATTTIPTTTIPTTTIPTAIPTHVQAATHVGHPQAAAPLVPLTTTSAAVGGGDVVDVLPSLLSQRLSSAATTGRVASGTSSATSVGPSSWTTATPTPSTTQSTALPTPSPSHHMVKLLVCQGGQLRDMRLVNDAVSDTGSNPTGALTMGPHGGPSPWVYEGGETRLVAVRRYCSYRELLDGLTKVAVNAPTLTVRYELPSDPSVLVDVVNDDDVALMFSELDEVAAEVAAAAVAHGRPGTMPPPPRLPRLKVYLQCPSGSTPPLSSADDGLLMRMSHPSTSTPPRLSSDSADHMRPSNSPRGTNHTHTSTHTNTNMVPTVGSRVGRLLGVSDSGWAPLPTPGGVAAAQHAGGGDIGFGLGGGGGGGVGGQGVTQQQQEQQQQSRRSSPIQSHSVSDEESTDPSSWIPLVPPPALRHSPRTPLEAELAALAQRLDIIAPEEIEVVRLLGSGSYGEVYLAKWNESDVAVKCLNASLVNGESGHMSRKAVAELIREADTLAALRHPNIVFVYGLVLPDFTRADSLDHHEDLTSAIARRADTMAGVIKPPAMVVEYMGARSLRGCLNRNSEMLTTMARVMIALDVAKGMEYLHNKSVVHLDLKSGNVLLGFNNKRPIAKVADFGLSKSRHATFLTNMSSQRGTLPWIAPEILRTPNMVTEKADVFSFGIMLWELWTGKEPYTDINYHALLMQLASNPDLRPPLPTGPDWPDPPPPPEPAPGWRVLMTRCWATDPAARPTFTEVVRSLKHMSSALRRARVCGGGGGVAGPPGGGLVSAFAGNAGGVGGGVGGPVRGHGGAAAKQPAEAAANAQAAPPYAAALAGGEAASGAAAPGVVGGATTKEGEEEGQKIEGEQVLYPVTTPFEPSLGVETGAIPPSE